MLCTSHLRSPLSLKDPSARARTPLSSRCYLWVYCIPDTACWPAANLQGGGTGGNFQDRHTTDMGGGMQSILERNDLDELMAMVSQADVPLQLIHHWHEKHSSDSVLHVRLVRWYSKGSSEAAGMHAPFSSSSSSSLRASAACITRIC